MTQERQFAPPRAGDQIGKDLLVLPPIEDSFSPAMADLFAEYEEAFVTATTAEYWTAIVDSFAKAQPACIADIAAKLMVGLHYAHPGRVGSMLAIDSEDFPVDGAGKVLCSVLGDLIALAGGDLAAPGVVAWNVAHNRLAAAAAAVEALPDGYTDAELNAACGRWREALSHWVEMTPPSPRHALERLAVVVETEGDALGNTDIPIGELIMEACRAFGVGTMEAGRG